MRIFLASTDAAWRILRQRCLCGQSVLPQTCTNGHEKEGCTQRRHVAKQHEIQEQRLGQVAVQNEIPIRMHLL